MSSPVVALLDPVCSLFSGEMNPVCGLLEPSRHTNLDIFACVQFPSCQLPRNETIPSYPGIPAPSRQWPSFFFFNFASGKPSYGRAFDFACANLILKPNPWVLLAYFAILLCNMATMPFLNNWKQHMRIYNYIHTYITLNTIYEIVLYYLKRSA